MTTPDSPALKEGWMKKQTELANNRTYEQIERRRRDLWIDPDSDVKKAREAHEWFIGPFGSQKELTWQDWKEKHLRSFQDVLFDKMEKEHFNVIAIQKHDKHAIEEDWPNLSRRDQWLLFTTGGNYAVKCGPRYNLLIVDLDPCDELPEFWRQLGTLTTRTGNGYHVYFRYNKVLDGKLGEEIYDLLCDTLMHRRKTRCCGSVLRYGG